MKTQIADSLERMHASVAARSLFLASRRPIPYRIARRIAALVLGDRPSRARDELATAIELDLVVWNETRKMKLQTQAQQ